VSPSRQARGRVVDHIDGVGDVLLIDGTDGRQRTRIGDVLYDAA
jgi:hypothetical protein